MAVLAIACLLGGCGSVTRVGSSGSFAVVLTEYHVAPQDVSLPSGVGTVFVHNYGRLTHNLVISRDGLAEASTQPIGPGQSAEIVTVLTPGQYLMASTVLSDQSLGTYGTITVR